MQFVFDANSGSTRSASLSIGGQAYTVTQAGSSFTAASSLATLIPSSAGLSDPASVAVDSSGNVYAVDSSNDSLVEWNSATRQVTTLISTGLSVPYAVAVDSIGNVYIADAGNSAVKVWSASTHQVSTLFNVALPEGVAVDPYGNVYASDHNNQTIVVWDAATQQTSTFSTGSYRPMGVAVDAAGNLYFTGSNDFTTYSVLMMSAATRQISPLLAGSGNILDGIAVDGAGNVYAGAFDSPPIVEIDALTHAATTFPDGLGGAVGVAVDTGGNLYFANNSAASEVQTVKRAYVDTAVKSEPSEATSDFVSVLPASLDLSGIVPLTSDAGWLTVGSIGPGVVSFSLAENTGPARVAHLTVLGQVITIQQAAAPFLLGSSNAVEGPGAGSGTIQLIATFSNGTWSATSNASWLHLPNSSGTGSANVAFTLDANSGPTRTGTLTIGGQTFAVTQAGTSFVPGSVVTLLGPGSGVVQASGVAVDAAGNVYIADAYTNAVKEWHADSGQLTTLADASAGLHLPFTVAVDAAGNVYIADNGNGAIKEWHANSGQLTTLLDASAGLEDTVYGLAVDAAGNLYFSEPNSNSINEWNAASGSLSLLADGSAGLNLPTGVAVDAAGNVYIGDSGNKSIKEWNAATGVLTTLADSSAGLGNINGVAVDATGDVYVADSTNDAIKKLPRAFLDAVPRMESSGAGSDTLTVLPASQNLTGPFAPSSDQTTWLTIDSAANGVVTFSFTENDTPSDRTGHLIVLGQSVTVTQSRFPAPTALDDVAYVDSTGAVTIDVLANDTSASGSGLTITSITRPALGRVSKVDNILTYTPSASFAARAGADTFSYTITDGIGTATATVTVRNPYYSAKGTYQGLVAFSGGASDGQPDGFLSLTLGGAGTFTGTLKFGPASYAFKGTFDLHGQATVTIQPSGKPKPNPISLALSFDQATGSEVIGSFTVNAQGYTASTGARQIYNAAANPDPSAGTYTVQLPTAAGLPAGTGWATMKVSEAGAVTLAGKLGDGTKLSVGAAMSVASGVDSFRFYLPLYTTTSKPAAPGLIGGTVTFTRTGPSNCAGALTWLKPAQTTGALYKSGFSGQTQFQGALYQPPTTGPVLSFSMIPTPTTPGAATVDLSGGDPGDDRTDTVAISIKNAVTETGTVTDKLKLTLAPKTGLLTGSFLAGTPSAKATAISGVIYQNSGVGQFLGTSESGSLLLTPH